jgi:hypothetical protein
MSLRKTVAIRRGGWLLHPEAITANTQEVHVRPGFFLAPHKARLHHIPGLASPEKFASRAEGHTTFAVYVLTRIAQKSPGTLLQHLSLSHSFLAI